MELSGESNDDPATNAGSTYSTPPTSTDTLSSTQEEDNIESSTCPCSKAFGDSSDSNDGDTIPVDAVEQTGDSFESSTAAIDEAQKTTVRWTWSTLMAAHDKLPADNEENHPLEVDDAVDLWKRMGRSKSLFDDSEETASHEDGKVPIQSSPMISRTESKESPERLVKITVQSSDHEPNPIVSLSSSPSASLQTESPEREVKITVDGTANASEAASGSLPQRLVTTPKKDPQANHSLEDVSKRQEASNNDSKPFLEAALDSVGMEKLCGTEEEPLRQRLAAIEMADDSLTRAAVARKKLAATAGNPKTCGTACLGQVFAAKAPQKETSQNETSLQETAHEKTSQKETETPQKRRVSFELPGEVVSAVPTLPPGTATPESSPQEASPRTRRAIVAREGGDDVLENLLDSLGVDILCGIDEATLAKARASPPSKTATSTMLSSEPAVVTPTSLSANDDSDYPFPEGISGTDDVFANEDPQVVPVRGLATAQTFDPRDIFSNEFAEEDPNSLDYVVWDKLSSVCDPPQLPELPPNDVSYDDEKEQSVVPELQEDRAQTSGDATDIPVGSGSTIEPGATCE